MQGELECITQDVLVAVSHLQVQNHTEVMVCHSVAVLGLCLSLAAGYKFLYGQRIFFSSRGWGRYYQFKWARLDLTVVTIPAGLGHCLEDRG